MAMTCTVCRSEDRDAVDAALIAGSSLRDIARRHELSKDAVARHKDKHLSPALATIQAQREVDAGVTAAERVEGLYGRAERILAAAEADGKASLSLQAIKELRAIVELLAKITGELDERPQTVNVLISPQWLEIRQTIVAALARHPGARHEVAAALAELEAGA